MAQYWDKRAVDVEQLIQSKTDQTVIKVNRLFNSVFKKIDKQILDTFETYKTNANLSDSEALQLLNVKETREYYEALKVLYEETKDSDTKQEILNRLNAPAYSSRIARLEALRDFVYCQALSVGWQTEKELQRRMIDAFKTSFYQEHYTIQKGTGLAYDFSKLENPIVRKAIETEWKGANYSERVWNNTHELAENLERILTAGLMAGISGKKMADELAHAMNTGRYKANRVIRTEVNWCAGQARLEAYKDAEIRKYMFVATLDLRTSTICRELDGKIFLVKDAKVGVNFPPMHPHCRSVDTAYVEGKDYSRMKRSARNPITGETEYVPQNMSYKEWYKKFVEPSEKARANEKAVKRGLLKPYKYTEKEIKEYFKQK